MDAPPPPPSHGAEVAVARGDSVGAAGLKEAGNKAFSKGDLEQAHKVRYATGTNRRRRLLLQNMQALCLGSLRVGEPRIFVLHNVYYNVMPICF